MKKIKTHMLTKRETETLQLIIQGCQNEEIAKTLCVTLHTVKVHIANIYAKFGVHNKVQAAIFAIKNNIIDVTEIE